MAASLVLFAALSATTSNNARAQGACTCLTVATSVASFCDTCYDSIALVGRPPHLDTFVICDTCYTFVITNNCTFGIQAIQIFDSASGGGLKQLHHGCSVVEYAAQDTSWSTSNPGGGSIMFKDTTGACWEPGGRLIVSICSPLKQGDTISMSWWSCDFPFPAYPPICLALETVTVP